MIIQYILVIALCSLAIPAFAINGLWVHPERVVNQELADKTLDQAQRCAIDNIYVLVFHREQAWFKTDYCPLAQNVPEGFDPLSYCIEAGHRRGMKVHAWFVNGQGGGGTILSSHPDWKAVDSDGNPTNWFDLTNPNVRRYQKDLMLSAARNYPKLDGLHFDYIRFPGSYLSYAPESVAAFKKATGSDIPCCDKFPITQSLSANPIHRATTARVLAEFDTGMPAIMENKLGRGRVLLFNWHADATRLAVLDSFLGAKLKEFGADSHPVRVLISKDSEKKYGGGYRGTASKCVKRAGYLASDAELDGISATDILIIPNVYIWSEGDASSLRKLVEDGLNVVWIDGPVGDQPDLMAVLGADRRDDFFAAKSAITPTVSDPSMPVGDEAYFERLDKQAAAWKQWRMDCITSLVRDVNQSAKRLRPGIEVTAAVFYKKDSADGVLQDWQRWVREGYLDYVIPMAYVNDNELAAAFDEWQKLPSWSEKVIPGLSIYRTSDRGAVPQSAGYVQSQVTLCKARNADGIVYFCCHYISPEMETVLKEGKDF